MPGRREIPAKYVGKIDRDLAIARSNLRLHLADFAKLRAEGDAPETVFAGFAQMALRDVPHAHAAVMFAAAVLVLHESAPPAPAWDDPRLRLFEVERTENGIELMHKPCGTIEFWALAEVTLASHVALALTHLGKCTA